MLRRVTAVLAATVLVFGMLALLPGSATASTSCDQYGHCVDCDDYGRCDPFYQYAVMARRPFMHDTWSLYRWNAHESFDVRIVRKCHRMRVTISDADETHTVVVPTKPRTLVRVVGGRDYLHSEVELLAARVGKSC
jgi:hypothetical protein